MLWAGLVDVCVDKGQGAVHLSEWKVKSSELIKHPRLDVTLVLTHLYAHTFS